MTLDNVIDAEIIDGASLPELAEAANRFHAEAERSARRTVEAAWYAGQALLAAKAQCDHGHFSTWLAGNFHGSHSIANKYMQVANSERVTNLDSHGSLRAALKAICAGGRDRKREREEAEELELSGTTPVDLRLGDFRHVLTDLSDVDAIITDPPYPYEFIELFDGLAETAARILKPGGLCAVMVGQSYLPEIFTRLGQSLTYRWTLAYLTPGGQAVQIWDRNVNTFWKPVLLFTNGKPESSAWIGDVTSSAVNDNDKNHHHWGQSESGMADLIRRLTKPGELICDPFLGGGTTAVVSHELGRRFVGCDIDQTCIETTSKRFQ